MLEVGNIVKIKPGTRFQKQNKNNGKITNVSGTWYGVEFSDGVKNQYQDSDLEIVSKIQIGDKVRVRKDLSERETCSGVGVNDDMIKLAGKEVTIKNIRLFPKVTYYICEDEGEWNWAESMFEAKAKPNLLIKDDTKSFNDKVKKIVAEIKKNKSFRKCFGNIEKEVKLWSFSQVMNYKLSEEK